MKKCINLFVVIFLTNVTVAFGALPPLYQTTNDLSNIADILKGLGNSSLMVLSVDINKLSATMAGSGNKTCQILFQRKKESHPPGWAGPAAPLEIKSNNCK